MVARMERESHAAPRLRRGRMSAQAGHGRPSRPEPQEKAAQRAADMEGNSPGGNEQVLLQECIHFSREGGEGCQPTEKAGDD